MPLKPEEIDHEHLPRARVGGFKPGPVAELLKRVSWDYRQALHENAKLQAQLEALQARTAELEEQLQAVQSRKPPDELARQAFATAQRAARELRESTREECELALKKARARAKQLDREQARALDELRDLNRMRHTLQERLQSTLQAALGSAENGPGSTERQKGQTQTV